MSKCVLKSPPYFSEILSRGRLKMSHRFFLSLLDFSLLFFSFTCSKFLESPKSHGPKTLGRWCDSFCMSKKLFTPLDLIEEKKLNHLKLLDWLHQFLQSKNGLDYLDKVFQVTEDVNNNIRRNTRVRRNLSLLIRMILKKWPEKGLCSHPSNCKICTWLPWGCWERLWEIQKPKFPMKRSKWHIWCCFKCHLVRGIKRSGKWASKMWNGIQSRDISLKKSQWRR